MNNRDRQSCKIKDSAMSKAIKRKSLDSSDSPVRKRRKKEEFKQIEYESESSSDEESLPEVSFKWKFEDVIAENLQLSNRIIKNVTTLFDQDNTIPFIARYRKELTENMDARKLTEVKENYENLKAVRKKIESSIQFIKKANKLTAPLLEAFEIVTTMMEVDQLAAPFKAGSKRTLAERARQLGLEPLAITVLYNEFFKIQNYVQQNTKGLSNETEIKTGTQHIISDVIAKDKDVLQAIRDSLEQSNPSLQSSKSRTADKEDSNRPKASVSNSHYKDKNSTQNFETYFEFSCSVRTIKPHQVLAINRGEGLKILSVKVIIPPSVKQTCERFCERRWLTSNQRFGKEREEIIVASVNDAWSRLIEPLLCRQIRSDLTKNAEKASVDVFVANLRQLLLTPPVRGNIIMGIDPGFRHGCKIAVISPTGKILHTDVIYLSNVTSRNSYNNNNKNSQTLQNIVHQFNSNIIGIGNGTACRETEEFVSSLISKGAFEPSDVKYCIVNECGASIYSVTEAAEKEMPSLDPNLRSAVSIARRLQDPLAEYVKIEPKHLGIGMYQHDISETMLKNALGGVVVECVSFVGVDLNTGSQTLLEKVAGLNSSRVQNIIEWRNTNGPFCNREQLKSVKGVGIKSFEQCAGFVRILPDTIRNQSDKDEKKVKSNLTVSKTSGKKKMDASDFRPNFFDMTCIHPESYNIATKFLKMVGVSPDKIGSHSLIHKVKEYVEIYDVESVANELKCGIPTLQLIVDGLSHPTDYDLRSEFETPLFRQGMSSLSDLKVDQVLTGRVTNVVHFGVFVDIGVGQDGLIHISKMRGVDLKIGDRVEVVVNEIDVERRRCGLRLARRL